MKNIILKHALINATEHNGRADIQAVLGKVIAEDSSLKEKVKDVIKEIQEIVEEVNSLSLEEQKKRFQELGIKIERKKVEERYELLELPNAKIGKVITAFPPEPSKYPHLGHAKAALINFLYAQKYKGKFIIRFEDSNPELAKKEYYKEIISGLKWLGIKWNKIDYLSNHMPKYYKTVETLIKKNHAYTCLCKQEIIKERRAKGETCEHREQNVKQNLELWKKMFKKIKEGQATVRLKIDMSHTNTTMRDPSIIRIVDTSHPRTGKKYRLWPVYDFGTVMLDIWEEVTHRVRSKEFEIRKELQQYIQRILGYSPPHIVEIGRFQIKDSPTQGRVIREMIRSKKLLGWDDPRLTTLIAIKRRGFVPEAIKEFLISTGVTKTEAVLEWEALEAFNRKHIDSIANRYFAVLDPVKISIIDAPKLKNVKINLHPDFPKRGKRIIPIDINEIYVERQDLEKFKNKEVALMNLFTVKLNKNSKFKSKEIEFETQKIQWVSKPNVKTTIVMSDGSKKSVLAEPEVQKLKVNDLIQFPRIGFCRVDKVGKEMVLYFAHK